MIHGSVPALAGTDLFWLVSSEVFRHTKLNYPTQNPKLKTQNPTLKTQNPTLKTPNPKTSIRFPKIRAEQYQDRKQFQASQQH